MDLTTEAIMYCEKHGIIEAHMQGENTMVYYSSYPLERSTIKAVVDLKTGKEARKYLSGYYLSGSSRVAGKYHVNYCV